MKSLKKLTLLMTIVFVLSNSIFAENRIVCSVTGMTDNGAEIELKWSEQQVEYIRIISWEKISDKTLKITYDKSYSEAFNGFNKRWIYNKE